jgi:hypothetical protein
MPDGTIPDPRMNDKEEKLGVVYFKKEFTAYDKTKFPESRYLPAGWKLDKEKSESTPAEGELFEWNGIPIKHKITTFVSEPDDKQGGVTLKIKKFIEANPKAIFKGVDSINTHKSKNQDLVKEVKAILDEDGVPNDKYRWIRDPRVILSAVITLIEAALAMLAGFDVLKWDKQELGLVMAVVVAIGGVIQAIWIADAQRKWHNAKISQS